MLKKTDEEKTTTVELTVDELYCVTLALNAAATDLKGCPMFALRNRGNLYFLLAKMFDRKFMTMLNELEKEEKDEEQNTESDTGPMPPAM